MILESSQHNSSLSRGKGLSRLAVGHSPWQEMAISTTNLRIPTDNLVTLVAVGLCLLALGWVFLRTDHLPSDLPHAQVHAEQQTATRVDDLPISASAPSSNAAPSRSPTAPIEVVEIGPALDATPQSVDIPAPVSAPARVTTPRLPFVFVGRMRDDQGWTVLLDKTGTKYIARQNDVLEGVWQIEAIDEEGITFRYAPIGTREHLALTAEGMDMPTAQLAPIARFDEVRSGRLAAQQYAALPKASTQTASDESAVTIAPPPVFQRRIVPTDIPREPWVCEASRANALLPCRNTWSMSEAQRVACRQAAEGSYKSCLGLAMAAPAEEE
jgi:hypothetical protein